MLSLSVVTVDDYFSYSFPPPTLYVLRIPVGVVATLTMAVVLPFLKARKEGLTH